MPAAWILAFAFVVRLAAAFWWQSRLDPAAPFEFGDSYSYWTLGKAVARGGPYQYGSPDARIFRTPGYPILLASVFWVMGDGASVMAARALSAACGTLAVGGVYVMARNLFDERTALVAATAAALYPGAIGTSVFVLSEAPFCPLVVANLIAWQSSWKAERRARACGFALASGALAAAATLMRPSWLLFVPFATVAALVASPDRKRALGLGLVMLVGLAVTMSPWWIRNARVVGRFVPTTLQVGASLYDGWHAGADGSSEMSFVPRITEDERSRYDPSSGVPFEVQLDARFRREAVAWARAHPARVLELAGVKFVRMWNVWPNADEGRQGIVRLAYLVSYVPIMAGAMYGLIRFGRRGWEYVLCWLPAVYLTALHVIFVGSIRYREPAMFSLIVLAAGAATTRWRGSTDRDAALGGTSATGPVPAA